jgi:general secretion pathway protein D
LLVVGLVVGCAQTPAPYQVPPARVAGQAPAPAAPASAEREQPASAGEAESDAPSAAAGEVTQMDRMTTTTRGRPVPSNFDASARFSSSDSITAAIDGIPLREFIDYSFTEVLKQSYVLADGLQGLDEPVTLNLQAPVSSRAYYRLVAELLDSRKIRITFREGVFYLHSVDAKASGGIPLGFGRRAQDVPEAPGIVMQVVPLRYGVNVTIDKTIVDLVNVQVRSDATQNAIFVTGDRELVLRALDVINLLDQPGGQSREVGIVDVGYVSAKELADQLVTLLGNEGYQVGLGRAEGTSIALVPLERLGALVVFAADRELLARAEQWIKRLDRPAEGPDQRYFIYHPRHSRASDLGESLAPLLGGTYAEQGNLTRDTRSALGGGQMTGTERTRSAVVGTTPEAATATQTRTGQFVTQENVLRRDTARGADATRPVSVQGTDITMSVDPRSNTLIFYTTGPRFQALLPMIRRLDVPPKQILLEATIAEVTLSGEFAYGVEFAFTDGKWSGGTLGNLGLPSGGLGLTYFEGLGDQVRLKLSQTNDLINVLSNPTLLVRDGVEAAIQVGNDVPTVGATATDPIESDRQITQVLYRKTGLDLRIRPTINAQGLVVMEIDQSISNTVESSAALEGAPTFFERSVSTEVVARSGQSILLAGLVSERQNDTTSRVPGISDIPGLGWLFRSDSKSKEKTELVVLLTPRILDDPSEWSRLRVGMQSAFEHLRLPEEPQAVAPAPAPAPAPGDVEECPDSDADGVCDANDRCARTLGGARVDRNGCEIGETVLRGITFGVGDAVLTPADRLLLDSVAETLRQRADVAAEIRGHTDDTGNAGFNLELSRARAEAVRSYLVSRGIAAERLRAEGFGEARPIASNATEDGRAQNRRVTLEFVDTGR